jgi:hypothetical protein
MYTETENPAILIRKKCGAVIAKLSAKVSSAAITDQVGSWSQQQRRPINPRGFERICCRSLNG